MLLVYCAPAGRLELEREKKTTATQDHTRNLHALTPPATPPITCPCKKKGLTVFLIRTKKKRKLQLRKITLQTSTWLFHTVSLHKVNFFFNQKAAARPVLGKVRLQLHAGGEPPPLAAHRFVGSPPLSSRGHDRGMVTAPHLVSLMPASSCDPIQSFSTRLLSHRGM